MINQPWGKRNWFSFYNAYTSGSNDVLITLSKKSLTTLNLNDVTHWNVTKRTGDGLSGWDPNHTRTILTIYTANTSFTLYDDPEEDIYQIQDFFDAMKQARLM